MTVDRADARRRHVADTRASIVTGLVEGIGTFDAATSAVTVNFVPCTRREPGTLQRLEASFLSGERSALRAIRELTYSVVDFGAGSWSIDLDTPSDVASAGSSQN